MGLHLNIPPSILPDATMREHRRRVWWTAYTFDRMWSAKLGFPHAISDTVIEVDLPSNLPEDADQDDIPECSYLVAMIGLARLTSQTMGSIYGSASQRTSLSQRVQSALTDLRKWKDELPESLMIKNVDLAMSDSRACYLQLMFNQVNVPGTPYICTFADYPSTAAHHLHSPDFIARRPNSPHTTAR
jgi:proline utilization trans-activator